MIAETAALGRAKGVALGADQEARTLGFLDALPPAMKSSMQLRRPRTRRSTRR
jgi:hypothetical protein